MEAVIWAIPGTVYLSKLRKLSPGMKTQALMKGAKGCHFGKINIAFAVFLSLYHSRKNKLRV
jgi:hypothetical protein